MFRHFDIHGSLSRWEGKCLYRISRVISEEGGGSKWQLDSRLLASARLLRTIIVLPLSAGRTWGRPQWVSNCLIMFHVLFCVCLSSGNLFTFSVRVFHFSSSIFKLRQASYKKMESLWNEVLLLYEKWRGLGSKNSTGERKKAFSGKTYFSYMEAFIKRWCSCKNDIITADK